MGWEDARGAIPGALSAQGHGAGRLANGHGALKVVCYPHSLTSRFLDLLPGFIYLKYPKSGIFFQEKGGSLQGP